MVFCAVPGLHDCCAHGISVNALLPQPCAYLVSQVAPDPQRDLAPKLKAR